MCQVREDSPHWLIEETERIRRGLLRLRQNVVLLKDPEQRDAFYPRSVGAGISIVCGRYAEFQNGMPTRI
jgi:hypothetical protein